MVIANLAEWLSAEDGDRTSTIAAVKPRVGAAGLMIAAAQRGGRFTQMERDPAIARLMKLLHVGNPEAKELIQEAEDELLKGQRSFGAFAIAVKDLDKDDQEALISHLWRLIDHDETVETEHPLMLSVRDVLGITRAQMEALKPAGG